MIELELGARYKDVITQFTGICTGHARYISGCSQVLLVPSVDASGKYVDGQWFDEQRVERQHGNAIVLKNDQTPGCDMQAPKR